MRSSLEHVYWIGGGSGGGKSTIARRLAAEFGLRLYSTDDAMADHARRSTPEDSPFLHAFAAMDMDERWLNRSPETMLATFHWFRGESFDLISDDLARMPRESPVVAEGFRLLPRLVMPLLPVSDRAVWLIPTPGFREAAFESRGTTWRIAGQTSDPPRALRNLLDRDRMFTVRLRGEVERLGLPIIDLDGTTTEDEVAAQVVKLFGLGARRRRPS